MDAYTPGSIEYIQKVAKRSLTNSNDGYVVMADRTEGAKYATASPWKKDYNQGEYLSVKSFSMNAGDRFGFMLFQHPSIQKLAYHPERYNRWGKRPLF